MKIILLALSFFLAPAVFAQQQQPATPDIEREGARPAEARKTAAAAEAASAESAGSYPTFEQVLERPDDVELNYRYAKGQIARGDLKGSAATLERVLMIKPELHRVRLVYAIVLYRLGNLSESERELGKLESAPLPDALKNEVSSYKKAVAKGRRKNHLAGRVAAGFEYDTNRNASPASGRRLFNDIELNATGSGARRDDTAALMMLGLDYRRDLPRAAQAFVSANYFRSEQTLLDTLDLQAYSVEGGAVLRPWARWEFTAKGLFDHVLLSQSTFLRNRGFSLRADRRWDRETSLFFQVRDVFNDYVRTASIPSAEDRTGAQIDVSAGIEKVLNPRMRLTGTFNHAHKNAREAFWAFDRDGLSLDHTWLLGRGAFLVSGLEGHWDRYRQPEVSISRKYRKDTIFRGSILLGAPLTPLSSKLKDLVASLSYDYYHAFSTVENYAYTNNKVAALLTYRFELGF